MNLIILGPPGSGKGTQSQFLKEQYNLMHLPTGDLFRDEITKQSPVGKKFKLMLIRVNMFLMRLQTRLLVIL